MIMFAKRKQTSVDGSILYQIECAMTSSPLQKIVTQCELVMHTQCGTVLNHLHLFVYFLLVCVAIPTKTHLLMFLYLVI